MEPSQEQDLVSERFRAGDWIPDTNRPRTYHVFFEKYDGTQRRLTAVLQPSSNAISELMLSGPWHMIPRTKLFLSNISPSLSAQLIPLLDLPTNGAPSSPAHQSLPRLLDLIVHRACPGDFMPDASWTQLKIAREGWSEAIHWLRSASNLSAGVGEVLVDTFKSLPTPLERFRGAVQIAALSGRFNEDAFHSVATNLLSEVTRQPNVIPAGLLPLLCIPSDGLPLSIMRNPLLLSTNSNLLDYAAELPHVFAHQFLSDSLHMKGDERLLYTGLFCRWMDKLEPAYSRPLAQLLIAGCRAVDAPQLIASLLHMYVQTGKEAGPRPLLEALTTDDAVECLSRSSDEQIATFLHHLHKMPRVASAPLADTLRSQGKLCHIVAFLSRFSKLGLVEAWSLARAGYGKALIDNMSSFSLSLDDRVTLTSLMGERGLWQDVYALLNRKSEQECDAICRRLKPDSPIVQYYREVGLKDPVIFADYCEAQRLGCLGEAAVIVQELSDLRNQMTGAGPLPESIKSRPGYAAMLDELYPAHGSSAQRPVSEHPDRSGDLNRYRFEKLYRIRTSSGIPMILKPGVHADEGLLHRLEGSILIAQSAFAQVAFKKKEMISMLAAEAGQCSSELPEVIQGTEAALFNLFLHSLIGAVPRETVKQLIIKYQFAHFEEIEAYLQGTRGEVRRAQNPQHAYLLALREHFADRLGDSLSQIIPQALSSPRLPGLVSRLDQIITDQGEDRRIQETLDRHQSSKRGFTPGLAHAILGVLSNPSRTDSEHQGKLGAINNIISKEQRRIAALIKDLTGEEPNPDSIQLDDFDVAKLECSGRRCRDGVPARQLITYYTEQFRHLFDEEVLSLDAELAKYKPTGPAQAEHKEELLEAFFTKNAASAYARAVAGVCVSGDLGQWNSSNYLQLVFRDASTKRCEGLVLLHDIKDRDLRILTASFNPTSTWLYRVNERELFDEIMRCLIDFAQKNEFDCIAASSNPTIRTNRSGGEFDGQMRRWINRCHTGIQLSTPHQFSVHPKYVMTSLDVLWEKNPK